MDATLEPVAITRLPPDLRVLLVEDNGSDAEMVTRALRGLDATLHVQRVDSEAQLRAALSSFDPHIVLSDYSMPGFSGQDALTVVRSVAPDLPFIFVSGTIGEEVAIEALQRGAVDYVLKDNLRRLPPAIERALRVARERQDLTRVERALRASEGRFRSIVESTADWLWEMNLDGVLTYSNAAILDILGFSAEDMVGTDALEQMLDEDRASFEAALPGFAERGVGWRNWVLCWRHRDGSFRELESTAQPLYDENGMLSGYRGIDRDVTLRRQQEAKIAQLGRIHAVLGALGNAVLRARDTHALFDQACRLAVEQGHFHAASIGVLTPHASVRVEAVYGDLRVSSLLAELHEVPLDSTADAERPAVRALRENRYILIEDYATASMSRPLIKQMSDIGVVSHIALPIGEPAWGVLCLFTNCPQTFDDDEIDLLERLTAEIDYARDFIVNSERLAYLAYQNPTTGLPNRTAFQELMAARMEQGPQLVAMADIDRFRYFNQTRGRGFGDQLLVAVAARLRAALPKDALLAHPGDDAFIFAHAYDDGIEPALAELETVLLTVGHTPLVIDGEEIQVSLKGSVLRTPADESSPEAIERGLSAMLGEAQDRNRMVLPFTQEVRMRATRRVELERELRVALNTGAFELYLQPKFLASTQRLAGAEALLRWSHPERGIIVPGEFIAVLEASGLIVEAGAWVRREALAITQRWAKMGHPDLRLAVNVSASELRQMSFVSDCESLLGPFNGEHGIDIEITESMVMDDINHSVQVLNSLRSLGCKIAIDDFGTGYSSLNYLSRLPADTLKIDRSFVALLAMSPDTLSLVTNIIGLAHSLGMTVVAEGVEDEEQAKLLRLLRCDQLQGYFLDRPMPLDVFERKYLD